MNSKRVLARNGKRGRRNPYIEGVFNYVRGDRERGDECLRPPKVVLGEGVDSIPGEADMRWHDVYIHCQECRTMTPTSRPLNQLLRRGFRHNCCSCKKLILPDIVIAKQGKVLMFLIKK